MTEFTPFLRPLPPPMFADSKEDTKGYTTPSCQAPKVDVVHITGDGDNFYVLTQLEQDDLIEEIEDVQTLMRDFQRIVNAAPEQAGPCIAAEGRATAETCGCQACQKLLWARKAEEAGLLALNEAQAAAQPIRLNTEDDIQGRIADLKEQRIQFAGLCPWVSTALNCAIGQGLTDMLDREVGTLQAQLAPLERMSESSATATMPDPKYGTKGDFSTTHARGNNQVVEVIVFSKPDKRYYISRAASDKLSRSFRIESSRLRSSTPLDAEGLKKQIGALLNDIKSGIKNDLGKPLGNLEARLKTWTAPHDTAANALHKEFNWTSDSSDGAPYAHSGEAHLLRFAAQASAGFSGFDPEAGEVSLGVKGQASFSLAEGKVSFARFLPSQGGQNCYFAYKNAQGETVYHRFGAFRLNSKLELSCFVGVVASGDATGTVKWKPAPSGASALLTSPELSSRGGKVQVKGNLFAGAQSGGALTGGLEWMHPDAQNRKNASWAPLLEIRTEGNLAFGGGAALDFQIMLTGTRLYFHLKGHLVFGPGAGGGFGTLVDLEKVADLVGVVYRNLSEVDFRHVFSLTPQAFEFFYQGVSQLLTKPGKTLNEVMTQGTVALLDWWEHTKNRRAAAHHLAKRILGNEPLQLGSQTIPLSRLPPRSHGTSAVHTQQELFVQLRQRRRESHHPIAVPGQQLAPVLSGARTHAPPGAGGLGVRQPRPDSQLPGPQTTS